MEGVTNETRVLMGVALGRRQIKGTTTERNVIERNTTPGEPAEYDARIVVDVPNIGMFHQAAIDVVRAAGISAGRWLDTGGGTGTLVALARPQFEAVEFTVADPSLSMIDLAKAKLAEIPGVSFEHSDTGGLAFPDGSFDVVTAIQCHHYLDTAGREVATRNCFRMLRPGGLYVTFENIRPLTSAGLRIGMGMWVAFEVGCGREIGDATKHAARFDTSYFPITIPEHIDLLAKCGFSAAEVLWASYLQAGFYAVK